MILGDNFCPVLAAFDNRDEVFIWNCIFCQTTGEDAYEISKHVEECHGDVKQHPSFRIVINVEYHNSKEWLQGSTNVFEFKTAVDLKTGRKRKAEDLLNSEEKQNAKSSLLNSQENKEKVSTKSETKENAGETCKENDTSNSGNSCLTQNDVIVHGKESLHEQENKSLPATTSERGTGNGLAKSSSNSNEETDQTLEPVAKKWKQNDKSSPEIARKIRKLIRKKVFKSRNKSTAQDCIVTKVVEQKGSVKTVESYECSLCSYTTSRHREYHSHMFAHEEKITRIKSEQLSTTLNTTTPRATVDNHVISETDSEKQFQQNDSQREASLNGGNPESICFAYCEFCESNIDECTALHKCSMCGVTHDNASAYIEHMEDSHQVKLYKTGSKFLQVKYLKKDVATEFTCNCGWTTNRHFNFHRHVFKHCCKESKFYCEYCEKPVERDSGKCGYGIHTRKCAKCGAYFYKESEYSAHMNDGCRKKPTGKLMCTECKCTFRWYAHIREHISNVHIASDEEKTEQSLREKITRTDGLDSKPNQKRMFFCELCDWAGDGHYNFHRHGFVHNGGKQYKCKVCNKSIQPEKYNVKPSEEKEGDPVPKSSKQNQGVLKAGSVRTSRGSCLVCETCGFSTHRADALRKHQVEHVPEAEREVYRCDECSYETFYKSSLHTHVSGKHRVKHNLEDLQSEANVKFCCELCGVYTSENQEELITHKHNRCRYRDADLATLKGHGQEAPESLDEKKHSADNTPIKEETTTDNNENLSENTAHHTLNIKVGVSMPLIRYRNEKLIFVCEYCNFKCDRRWNMIRHKECLHKRQEMKCSLCAYSSKYLPWMSSHYKNIHFREPPDDIKKYMDSQTKRKKRFVDKNKPNNVKQKIKREICQYCGKSVIASALKRHFVTAHDIGESHQYRCDYTDCTFTTIWSNYLARHIRRVHMPAPRSVHQYKCHLCNYPSKTLREHNNHLKHIHYAPSLPPLVKYKATQHQAVAAEQHSPPNQQQLVMSSPEIKEEECEDVYVSERVWEEINKSIPVTHNTRRVLSRHLKQRSLNINKSCPVSDSSCSTHSTCVPAEVTISQDAGIESLDYEPEVVVYVRQGVSDTGETSHIVTVARNETVESQNTYDIPPSAIEREEETYGYYTDSYYDF